MSFLATIVPSKFYPMDKGATPDEGATPEGASLFRQRAHTMADTYKKKSSAKKRLREAFKSKKCGKFPKIRIKLSLNSRPREIDPYVVKYTLDLSWVVG